MPLALVSLDAMPGAVAPAGYGKPSMGVVGTDDTSLQPVHARRRYLVEEIVWGARHADVLSEDDHGNVILDVRRFHDIVPTVPIDGFPYPRPPAGRS